MSSGRAVTKKTVRKVVDPVASTKCELALPGVCMGSGPRGVQRYLILDEGREVHACPACYEELIGTGHWADEP